MMVVVAVVMAMLHKIVANFVPVQIIVTDFMSTFAFIVSYLVSVRTARYISVQLTFPPLVTPDITIHLTFPGNGFVDG